MGPSHVAGRMSLTLVLVCLAACEGPTPNPPPLPPVNLDAALARDAEAGVPLDGAAPTCDVRTNCLPTDYCHSSLCVSGLCAREERPDGTVCDAAGTKACIAGACVPIAIIDAGTPTGEPCEVGVNCFSSNPCQPALCVAGQCASRFLSDGSQCGASIAWECKAGFCVTATCGTGAQTFGVFPDGERCDDSNRVNGDGCDVTCTPEVVQIDRDPADSSESVGTSTAQNVGVDGANRAIVVYRRRYASGVESVLAQRLGAWGAPIDTTPLVIDQSIGLVPTSGDPTVIGLSNGWVVAWASGARTGSFDVFFRIVSANGAMTDVTAANRSTLGTQWDPELAAIASGFVIGWSDQNGSSDDYGSGVVARVFDVGGNGLSPEIRLASDRGGHEGQLAIASYGDRWLAAWETSSEATGWQPQVRARAFEGLTPLSTTETNVPVAPMDTPDLVPLSATQTFGFSARNLADDAHGDFVFGQFRADGAFIELSTWGPTPAREGKTSVTIGPGSSPAMAFELDARGRADLYSVLSTEFTDLTWSLRYRMLHHATGNVSVVGDRLGYWVGFQEDTPNAIQDAFSVIHLPTPEGEFAQCVANFGASAPECAPAIDTCVASTCSAHGTCTPKIGATPGFCTCDPGFKGSQCQRDVNECSSPTMCGADQLRGGCWNYPGYYVCACAVGYERTNPDTPTENCGIISCPSLTAPSHGAVTTSPGLTYLSVATYACDVGYSLSSTLRRACQADKSWSGTEPTCDITNCGAAPSVSNATAPTVAGGIGGGSTTTYNATAAYTCNAGYAKSGGNPICQANGAWSAAPTCAVVNCGAVPTVANSDVPTLSGGIGGGPTYGATVSYTCNTGYTKIGSNPTCQQNGSWSTAPTCAPTSCGAATTVANAATPTVSGGNGGGATTTYGATAMYTCNTGYTKTGSDATCQASGSWTAAPTCSPTNCGAAPTVANAGAATVSGGLGGGSTTTYGATATYTCNTGYAPSGNNSTCQANGTWSAAPVCTAQVMFCPAAPAVTNAGAATVSGGVAGGSTTSYQATAAYTCNTGYTKSGSNATCQANATWSALPVCTAIASFCPVAPSVMNAAAATVSGGVAGGTTTSYQATAAYTCNSGYSKSGGDSLCQANATWSTAPVCADINECMTGNGGCNANALCTNTAGSRTCTCNPGYTGDGFTCTIVSCGSLTAPTNGTVSTPGGVTYGQMATYGCNAGYLLTELPTRTCDASGAWSGTAPLCVPNADQGWVHVTNATSSHTVATTDRYLSHGSTVSVIYRGTGQYGVTLSSMAGGPTSRPVVVVTSTSATSARCQVLSYATNAGTSNLKVEVRCVQPTTAAYVDSTFNLMVWHTFGATSSTLGGYLLTPSANPGTSALVNADASNSYDWTGATVQWQRTGTGAYYVSMPGTTGVDCSGGTPTPKPPVTFVASSYGGSLGDVCVVSGYFSGAGTAVGAYVNCYGANGAAKDARFALMAPPYSSATQGTAYSALSSAGVVSTCVTTNTALGTRTTNLASHASTGNYVLESRAFAVNGMAFAAANATSTPAYCNPSTVTTATTWCSGTRPITTTTVNCYSLAGAAIDSAFSIIERGTIQTCP